MNRYNITVTFINESVKSMLMGDSFMYENEFKFMAMGDSFMDAQWKVFGDEQLAQFIGTRKIRSILVELAEVDIDVSFGNNRW